MKSIKMAKRCKFIVSTLLSALIVVGSVPFSSSAASAEIWPGYPGVDQLPAINTISNPFKFFNVKNDPNGDGIVSNPSEWTARKEEIRDLVQHYWLGYRWPTQAKDVSGETKVLNDPNTISVGLWGMGGTFNLGTEFKKLEDTLKTSSVEIRKVVHPSGGFGSDTLGDVVTTIGPAKDPNDTNELQSLAIKAWNAGYYIPYTSFAGTQYESKGYAVFKESTGAISAPPAETKPVPHNVITITNPDSKVKASFNISVAMPTSEQIKKAWGSETAKVPFVIDIGGASAMSAANLNPQGYALVTFNATDIYADSSPSDGNPSRDGIYTKLYPYNKADYKYASGALMAWGWGVSQIISAMSQPVAGGTQTYGDLLGLDPTKTVVTGHSRYAKAAMFAAAFDDRISICVPSESGGSGIQSYRYKVEGKIFGFNTSEYAKADRVYGSTETPSISYGKGTSWFPETAANFVGKDNQLPFDADDIISLVAPRPFYTVTGIDTHWLGNEGGVASVQAASEVYDFIGKNEIEKTNIAIQARESDHVFYPRDFCFALAIMDRTFKQGSNDQVLHVQDLFPNGTGKNGMSYPAADYKTVSAISSYPFDINSSYLPWSSANKYTLWTAQESFLVGRSVTITAHSDAPDVDLYLPDKTTKIDASKHEGDTFTFNLTPAQSVYGRYELRTAGSEKSNRSVFFSAVSLSDSLRHATSKGDQGEENRMIGFASRLANTQSDAPLVYIGGSATPISMCFNSERFPKEETSLKEYGILFHDNLFTRIANEGNWDATKTFDIKNLKFVTIPGFNFEISFNNITASAKNDGKDGADKFTQPISWGVEKYNNGPETVWPAIPNTTEERTALAAGKTVTRPDAPAANTTKFKAQVTDIKTSVINDNVNVIMNFSEPMDKGQFGFGLNVANKWNTVWNDDGTQVTLSIAKSDITENNGTGDLIIFRLMDKSGNLIGGPIEKTFTLPTTVTNVAITPVTATVQRGKTQTFTAAVSGEYNPVQAVTWSVSGNVSSNTKIDASGILTVADNETADTLTVKATSTVDSKQSGTAVVTVKAPTFPATITDTNTKVTFDISNATLPTGVTSVSVGVAVLPKTGSDSSVYSAVRSLISNDKSLGTLEKLVIYDLKLLDQNGNPVTGFTGKIKVKIPIPDGMSGNLHVFWYNNAGKLTDMNATVDGNYLVFETTHFSNYAIAQLASNTTTKTTDNSKNTTVKNPKTGSDNTPIIPLALLGAGSMAGLLILTNRKKRKAVKSMTK